MVNLIQNVLDMISLFTDVALNGPLPAILLAFGTLFVAVSVAAFGYLTLGAVVDFILPESLGRKPPQQG
ncbi:hypothetical protein [Halorussus amylolyticus]|uniref:hypothetical protein n=1 Tax=Halorussus amylolyticus TaxID=1126242 RepID=UPI00104A5D34|nr:hypothetical protein [Halorussus amylolyticus]